MIVKGGRRSWEVGDRLEAGGFGEVYFVKNDPDAVIKLVPKDPGAEREFLVEDLSGVRNVIPLLDRGETEGRWAFIMPRAEKSLRKHLVERAGKALDLTSALAAMIDVAEALVDLSRKEVVHRDLKPENILLFNGRWCLADFGISRYAEATTAADTRKFAMSPPYAAPEQWRFERANSSTDIYALGVIGYELLGGVRPFMGPDFREQHLVGRPPSLASLPVPLAALIEQCLLKAPGSRPTPEDLLQRLQRQASATPATGGLAALQEANRSEVTRLSEEARLASEAQNEAERRRSLWLDGQRQLRSMAVTLLEAVKSAAPAATASEIVQQSVGGVTHGWRVRLGDAKLDFMPPTNFEAESPFPFDVIAWCVVAALKPQDHSGYEGRSHSLWFCDAQERGQFRWYETAFITMPYMNPSSQPIDPFALDPLHPGSGEAIRPGVGSAQVAWPFTPVEPGEMDDFIDRWTGWFAQAAMGELSRPGVMPERSVDGSWRLA